MKSKIVHQINLMEGGATSPTVQLYQRSNGRCRIWWYALDQEGSDSGTVATFMEKDWATAVKRGMKALHEFRSAI